MSSDMVRNEVRSQLYAFLGDATANPDGDAWDHDRLQVMVDKLIDLPAIQGLMVAREATFRERYDLMRQVGQVRQIVDAMDAESYADRLSADDFDRGAAWGREDSADRIRAVLDGAA